MRGRAALLLLALFAAFATPAQVRAVCPTPDGPSSSLPACINVVGHNGIAADPAGTFIIIVRCDPITVLPSVPVTLIFDACSDISICNTQLDPSKIVTCGLGIKQISGVTDAFGIVTFSVIGRGTASPFSSADCMTVTAGSPPVVLGSVSVGAFDLDGIGPSGVGANDLSVFLADFGTGDYLPRSDFDCSGGVGANDFSVWFTVFGSGSSAQACPTIGVTCP